MKHIWNTFCDEISKNKGVKEMTFEKNVVTGFLQALGWSIYANNLEEQSNLYKGKWRPDFVFYLNGDKKAVEVILELKKPDHKQRLNDIEQIEAYMKLTDCRFGLYFGEKLEVFYLQDRDGKRIAKSVTNIDWTKDNEAGLKLIELLNCSSYNRSKLEEFCKDHVELKSFLKLWKSPLGQQKLYEGIIKHFMLSPTIASSLQSYLKFTVLDTPEEEPKEAGPAPVVANKKKTTGKRAPKVWMISANAKFFDHRKCFDELGYIYWKQYNKLQVGDTGYIYYSKPHQKVVFKFEIVACDLPYTADYDAEKKYYKKLEDYESAIAHNRFYKIIKLGESTSGKLTLGNMQKHGLKKAPLGAIELSDKMFEQLLAFICENF